MSFKIQTKLTEADFLLLAQSLNSYLSLNQTQEFLSCFQRLGEVYNSQLLLRTVYRILKIYPKAKRKREETQNLLFAVYPHLQPQPSRLTDLFQCLETS